MRYATKAAKAAYQARWRAKQKALKAPKPVALPKPPEHPADALAKWCKSRLVVPPGHPLAGRTLVLPAFGRDYLADALRHRESLLCVARKNAKSAIVAAYLLCRLVGPLRTEGYRAGIVSVNRDKAGELWSQMRGIALASGLDGLAFRKSPRCILGPSGSVDILSADASAGHASGFDDAICDELGLFRERDRDLVAGLRSSTSARDGRFMALSIMGGAPFTAEMIERADDPAISVHLYAAPADCALDDPAAWHAANPGLALGIKSLSYMADTSRMALASASDQRNFRAFDLNQPVDPGRELIVSLSDWRAAVVAEAPPRRGPVCIGFDLGGSDSMTALCAAWPATGRLEVRGAFGNVPNLADRGRADGVGAEYLRWRDEGTIRTYPGRTTPVADFLKDCAADLDGSRVIAAGADRYRRSEAIDALEQAGVRWPMQWRGTGASARADGSRDVRAFQRAIRSGALRPAPLRCLAFAVMESELRYDPAGNPALDKRRHRSRIDALQAAVIAAGLAEQCARPKRRRLRHAVA